MMMMMMMMMMIDDDDYDDDYDGNKNLCSQQTEKETKNGKCQIECSHVPATYTKI